MTSVSSAAHVLRRGAALGAALSTALAAGLTAAPALADEPGAFAKAAYTVPLADVCPSPLYLQKDWLAQAEHGGLYQLIGAGGTMEPGRYSGPLGSTGIELVLLEGGNGLGLGDGESSYSALFHGNSRAGVVPHLGFQELDIAYLLSARFPVVGVFATLENAPSGIIWDPATYPEGFSSVEDLIAFGKSGKGMIYLTSIVRSFGLYLVNSGVPKEAFVEGYRGDLENFVANNGAWLNQGFITTEIFNLSHGRAWGKPVAGVSVNELGYPNMTGMVAVARSRLDELAPCLEKLVPLMQQAAVDYLEDPAEVNQLIADFTEAGHSASWWRASRELNDFSAEMQKSRGLVGNGPNETVGDFDPARAERMLEILRPTLDERANPEVKAEDVYTNRFIDPSIGVK